MSSTTGRPADGSAPRSVLPYSPVTIAITLLAVLTVFRLWYVTRLGLVADETFYWLWSKHLAASYTDKGPGIAWLIAAGTSIFGDTPLGIRFWGVILSAGTGWQLFRLARRLYDDRTALWVLAVASVIPLFGVGAVIMTIDTPSVFCWAWAANVFWTALDSGKTRHWFGLGLIIGLGFLAKFTNIVQLGSIGLFLLWSAPHRKFIFSRQSLALLVGFGLCTLPIVWWNYTVGWLQVTAVHSRSGMKGSYQIHPLELLRFWGEQIGIISPLIGLGIVIAAFGLLASSHRDSRVRFLLCQFFPIYGLFSFFSLNAAGKGNWPVPGLVGGVVLVTVFWLGVTTRRPGWRWGVGSALVLGALMTVILHVAAFVSFPLLGKLMNRSEGWPDYAAHIQQARDKYQPTLLIGDHYSTVSLAQFYLKDHPTVYQPTGWHPQFKLWGGYQVEPATRALFITTEDLGGLQHWGAALEDEFNLPVLADDFWTQENGRKIKRFHIYYLTGKAAGKP